MRFIPEEPVGFYDSHTGARAWARWMLYQPDLVILDTETTGLDGWSEAVSIAAVDREGNPLLNTRVKPTCSIPGEATDIHGIMNRDVADAPTFLDLYPQIKALFQRQVVIYNASYDTGILHRCCAVWGLPPMPVEVSHCAMLAYAAYYGDWSDYFGSFKWQKLSVAAGRYGYEYRAHDALCDCLATLQVMRGMAGLLPYKGG